ncbi:MAG: adenylyltransferase [Candidatus Zambryskibacteria bacterium RIFCSPLOWO2_02_FULL_44_12b]|uniref:Adenylyl-sulfate kinase n=1 Tax=Candidatus Zambryskibacteria bacterium RIFCSPLOWO2_02_FULL_44_12b TaxID=1802772 RepID=A0A1G2UNE1_9BACT|nr:MAG: adenylyltransferase [Candidatus Zambryskibacteria bacterium RIFCSPLOWO2_02_FULL_44_12b]
MESQSWLIITKPEEINDFWEKSLVLPRLNLSDKQLLDLELILNGGFHPLKGFLNQEDYESVVDKMRLKSGAVWPMPITLDVEESLGYKVGEEVLLCDKYGNPIAIMVIKSIFKPDKEREALEVFGTNDQAHPGVQHLFQEAKEVYIGGSVRGIGFSPKYDFKELRFHPHELKKWFKDNSWDKVVAFQTRNPTHRAHFELMSSSAKAIGGKVLMHPVVGLTKQGDIDYITRVRSYKRLYEKYMKGFAKLALLPLAMRMGGPREALWHALIRKNYGATHFIVGRDHAGPGNDSTGKEFYGPYDAQELVKAYEEEIGIKIVPQKEHVYVKELDVYLPEEDVNPEHTVKSISGTQFRKMLAEGSDIPSWFSFPEVIDELRKSILHNKEGVVIFFTGLSGSGKSTVSNILATKLLEIQNRKITILDGDVVRQNLSRGLGFSREDRNANIERIGFVANEVARHGGIAICAAIAPYAQARDKNRSVISKSGTYVEVYMSTSLEVCMERDTKGFYKKAAAGKMSGLTGINDPYEVPKNPEIVLDTEKHDPEECADFIIEFLRSKKLI